MSDERPIPTPPAPQGGDRPAPARRLERAPGERYAGAGAGTGDGAGAGRPATATGMAPAAATTPDEPAPATPRPRRALGLAVLAAFAGSAIVFAIGNLDLGSGLVALSAAVGWATGLALAEGGGRGGSWPKSPGRPVLAGALAALGVAGAMLALGLYAQVEGGVLPPIDYLAQRFGPLPLVDIAVAGLAGAIRAR